MHVDRICSFETGMGTIILCVCVYYVCGIQVYNYGYLVCACVYVFVCVRGWDSFCKHVNHYWYTYTFHWSLSRLGHYEFNLWQETPQLQYLGFCSLALCTVRTYITCTVGHLIDIMAIVKQCFWKVYIQPHAHMHMYSFACTIFANCRQKGTLCPWWRPTHNRVVCLKAPKIAWSGWCGMTMWAVPAVRAVAAYMIIGVLSLWKHIIYACLLGRLSFSLRFVTSLEVRGEVSWGQLGAYFWSGLGLASWISLTLFFQSL